MLKFINRYIVSILLAIGLHALLLLAWTPALQPIQLRLLSGDQAISLQLTSTPQPLNTALVSATRSSADKPQIQSPSMATRLTKQNSVVNKTATTPVETSGLNKQKSHQQESLINREPPLESEKTSPVSESVAEVSPAIVPASSSPISPDIVTKPTDTTSMPAGQTAVLNKPSEVSSIQLSPVAATKPKGVFAVAQPLSANNPKYPRRAIMRNQQGRVKVNLRVDESGYVDNIELIESSGYAMLDDSVFKFAEEERFVPATQDGIPVASTQFYLFRFVLE